MSNKANFTGSNAIKQGATFTAVFRWESKLWTHKAISAISKAAPARVTAPTLPPDGWRAWVTGCKGMTQINAEASDLGIPLYDKDAHKVTLFDATNLDLNDVNSVNFGTYTSGGVLSWKTPNDLAGYTARMQIRDSVDATAFLIELTNASGIAINNTTKTITVTLSAAQTAAITWESAVYDLELVSAGGAVTRIAQGTISVNKEVTR